MLHNNKTLYSAAARELRCCSWTMTNWDVSKTQRTPVESVRSSLIGWGAAGDGQWAWESAATTAPLCFTYESVSLDLQDILVSTGSVTIMLSTGHSHLISGTCGSSSLKPSRRLPSLGFRQKPAVVVLRSGFTAHAERCVNSRSATLTLYFHFL